MSGRVLIVFVKAPRPGQVKTRLAADVGPQRAAAVYRTLAEGVLARTAPGHGEYERWVSFAPADAQAEVAAWLPGEVLRPQADGDLGARMDAAFSDAFAGGASAAVLVGSDVPRLGRDQVRAAFAALEEAAVVLGPATDGGYYLVGLRERRPQLFADMAWGSPSVLAETQRRCQAEGLALRLLEPLSDVDTASDLRALP